jgi:hypothetical protein
MFCRSPLALYYGAPRLVAIRRTLSGVSNSAAVKLKCRFRTTLSTSTFFTTKQQHTRG